MMSLAKSKSTSTDKSMSLNLNLSFALHLLLTVQVTEAFVQTCKELPAIDNDTRSLKWIMDVSVSIEHQICRKLDYSRVIKAFAAAKAGKVFF